LREEGFILLAVSEVSVHQEEKSGGVASIIADRKQSKAITGRGQGQT
jgi:hypothetical protein